MKLLEQFANRFEGLAVDHAAGNDEDLVCASPAYLKGLVLPQQPRDLTQHRGLLYLNPARVQRWTFRRARQVEVIEVDGPTAYNYHTALLEPLLAGLGIAKLPSYFVEEYPRDGRLVRLLSDYQCDSLPIHLVHRALNARPPESANLSPSPSAIFSRITPAANPNGWTSTF